MIVAGIALVITGVVYFVFLAAVSFGLRKVTSSEPQSLEPPYPFVSVIVPARNESELIGDCLDALSESTYPESRFEVIVVDDHSTDDTSTMVKKYLTAKSSWTLVSLNAQDPSGKSAALSKGIETASGDFILTTDSDCKVSPDWIMSTVAAFSTGASMVAGTVLYKGPRTIFARLQTLEFFGLVMVGAGCIGLKRPTICNSSNLAYRKEILDKYVPNGFDSDSAADEKLIQILDASSQEFAVFNSDHHSNVYARPVENISSFLRQRQRWAASTGAFASLPILIVASAIFLYFVLLVLTPALYLLDSATLPYITAGWILKVTGDAAVLLPATRHFENSNLLRWFVPAQLVHAPYVVAATLSAFTRKGQWKGRGE